MKNKSIKVVFDTNVWISFIIGKQLSSLKKHLSTDKIIIIYSQQLITEIELVTSRPKLTKYFYELDVKEMIELIKEIGEEHKTVATHKLSRDEKDNFLLDLIDISKANFLVTGDKDLLVLNPFKSTEIITPSNFEKHQLNN